MVVRPTLYSEVTTPLIGAALVGCAVDPHQHIMIMIISNKLMNKLLFIIYLRLIKGYV